MYKFLRPYVCLSALSLVSGTAFGQTTDATTAGFRPGQPVTLSRPARPADPAIAISNGFSKAYAKAKLPRMVIFWNREFSDEIATEYEDYDKFDQDTTRGSTTLEERTAGPAGDMTITESDGNEHVSSERRSGVRKLNGGGTGRRVTEKIDFDLEQAVQETLRASGARLVDRTSIMRTAGVAERAGALSNVQEIETKALLGKSDLIIEITQFSDDDSARGVSFKVVCRDIRNARILTSFRTTAEPPAKPLPYVAGPNGFERAKPRAPRPYEVGRELAVELMGRLAAAL